MWSAHTIAGACLMRWPFVTKRAYEALEDDYGWLIGHCLKLERALAKRAKAPAPIALPDPGSTPQPRYVITPPRWREMVQ